MTLCWLLGTISALRISSESVHMQFQHHSQLRCFCVSSGLKKKRRSDLKFRKKTLHTGLRNMILSAEDHTQVSSLSIIIRENVRILKIQGS